jgi:hypothetical protein
MIAMKWIVCGCIYGVYWFRMAIVLRERNRLRREVVARDQQIEKLCADALIMLDQIRAYRGAWNAIAPKEGEIHLTRIIRPEPTVEKQIKDMLGPVREGDPR